MKKLFALFLVLFCVIGVIAQDTTYQGQAGIADVADSDPGLFIFMMFMLMVMIAALLLTIILAMAFWGILMALTFAGIVSLSVFMGWYQNSVRAGVLWFIWLCFGAVGVGSGVIVYLIVLSLSDWTFSWGHLLLYAVPAGLLGGMIAGWIFLKVMRRLVEFVKAKFVVEGRK